MVNWKVREWERVAIGSDKVKADHERESGWGRTEDKVIEAAVKELSCQDVGSDSFYTDIEITKSYDQEPGIKASKEDGDN